MIRAWLPALLALSIVPVCSFAADKDLLQATKDRARIESQRIESEFTAERSAAYKLVRTSTPNLVEATEKLQTLLSMLENDTALESRRRQQLIVTIKFDLEEVKKIAGDRRRNTVQTTPPPSVVKRDLPSQRYEEERRTIARDTKSIIESRNRDLTDSRTGRLDRNDRFNRVMRDVDKSSIPETRAMTFPPDYLEKMKKRSTTGIKMTAKERAIMTALNKTLDVDFNGEGLNDVLDYLRKVTGFDIVVDKRGMEDAGVSYESKITLKMKASARTVIKRVLADLGLAYVIKEEAMQVTSRERASQMTTTRTYYIGDLANVVDVNIPPFIAQLQALERVNRIVTLIKTNVETKSWKENNPDAPGSIVFDPVSMTLVVKQTAEIHFMMNGK